MDPPQPPDFPVFISRTQLDFCIMTVKSDGQIRRSKEKAIPLFLRTNEKCKKQAAQKNYFASLQMQKSITNEQ